jgi:hypothetical protein
MLRVKQFEETATKLGIRMPKNDDLRRCNSDRLYSRKRAELLLRTTQPPFRWLRGLRSWG